MSSSVAQMATDAEAEAAAEMKAEVMVIGIPAAAAEAEAGVDLMTGIAVGTVEAAAEAKVGVQAVTIAIIAITVITPPGVIEAVLAVIPGMTVVAGVPVMIRRIVDVVVGRLIVITGAEAEVIAETAKTINVLIVVMILAVMMI